MTESGTVPTDAREAARMPESLSKTSEYVEVDVPAFTCDDEPQPATLTVTASPSDGPGVMLEMAEAGEYASAWVDEDGARTLIAALTEALAHLAAARGEQ